MENASPLTSPMNEEFIVCTWPRITTCVPRGSSLRYRSTISDILVDTLRRSLLTTLP